MVRIANNKSLVTGTLLSVTDDDQSNDFCTALIKVQAVESVPGFSQLFRVPVGEIASLNIRREDLPAINVGKSYSFLTKAGGPRLYYVSGEITPK